MPHSLLHKTVSGVMHHVEILKGRMSIVPDKHSYHPGEAVIATIEVEIKKPVKASSLEATLSCVETKRTESARIMDHYDYREERELGVPPSTHMRTETRESTLTLFSQKKKLAGEREYQKESFSVEFHLPGEAKPTSHSFGHGNAKRIWKLTAKLDIPFAFDKHASKEIVVKGG